MTSLRDQLQRLVAQQGRGPIVVHSDLFRAGRYVPRVSSRSELLQAHLQLLQQWSADRGLWLPCFNYDFTKTGRFDARRQPCQLGPLGEHFRQNVAQWRTSDPVFSFAGWGPAPASDCLDPHCDPFGPGSAFAQLVERRATLLFYGAPFSSATLVHYAERYSGGPIYRYDKVFPGTVIDQSGNARTIQYTYHVRPWQRNLEYDWNRLHDELLEAGVLRYPDAGHTAFTVQARDLFNFWVERLRENPFYLLDEPSRSWAVPEYQRRGRRFQRSDFES